MYLPEEEKYSCSRVELESNIETLFCGRIAEEITLGAAGVTTGASNDIERATDIARRMVTEWGLSEKLGPIKYKADSNGMYSGEAPNSMSAETTRDIDAEIRSLIERNYQLAEKILTENRDVLETMKDALMKYETIDAKQIDDLMNRVEVREPASWAADKKEKDRADSDKNDSAKSDSDNTKQDDAKDSSDSDTDSKPSDS
jgi:cell division protease FtsH